MTPGPNHLDVDLRALGKLQQ